MLSKLVLLKSDLKLGEMFKKRKYYKRTDSYISLIFFNQFPHPTPTNAIMPLKNASLLGVKEKEKTWEETGNPILNRASGSF